MKGKAQPKDRYLGKKVKMHRKLCLPDFRLTQKPDAGYRISGKAGHRISGKAGYRISSKSGYRIPVSGKAGYRISGRARYLA
jgi:hypothetical protein